MIIKCKMCGGDIQFNPGDTNGQCDHCGCTTTFPKLPDEQRTNLFNRANHFRRQCEFDKAMAAYEHILEEDETDAEAHWGIVLSKFGIEYVEDPVTHERIPTCHRAQVISILSDEDYQNALKYAPDTYSREIYEKEAKRIAVIQKGILAISSQEKPYDVFICYKETDDSGSRTKDSTLAQEIYYQLTNEGYKVFFSRITLEDKLGQEYEPYIFAALNSAKVMLVVGTKPEFFNAVWVKNEWSRYLALMKNDRKRVLIPCYRDMDAYDLPEELSALQSQDMGKIGFMQDIIHGVKKVNGADKQTTASNVTVQAAGPGVTSLHKRAVLFLEDSDWDSATEYFDRILDIDPEYAPAYIGKVQVKNKVRREADLARCREPISTDADFQKAVRFADEKQKAIYNGYNRAILDRVALERKEAAYREAVALESRAAVEADFLAAARKFDSAEDIRDAKERAANCRAKASTAKTEAEKAAAVYKAQMERESKERERQEQERLAVEAQKQKEEAERQRREELLRKEKQKRAIKIGALFVAIVLLMVGSYTVYINILLPNMELSQAQNLLKEGRYDEAYAALVKMENNKDAKLLLESDENLIHISKINRFKTVGESVYFGRYEQDNNNENGPEEIEWIVLDVHEGKSLLLSKYALETKAYHDGYSITWKDCTLRSWLNNEFCDTAFSQNEKQAIMETLVDNSVSQGNTEWNTNGGSNTEDLLFLLSYHDVTELYYDDDASRVCYSTAHANMNYYGAKYTKENEIEQTPCLWLLRSPGMHQDRALCVSTRGTFTTTYVFDAAHIRPALWINWESGQF